MTRRVLLTLPFAAVASARRAEEIRHIAAAEATQAVAVDERFLYAIGNHAIGKYDKKTGQRVAGWECENGQPLIHLDSGVVHGGKLVCAHSNYPGVPMVSSIETWDTASMQHTGSHSFGILHGSATWVDLLNGFHYVTFAHYKSSADEATRDPRWTLLVEFTGDWQQRQSWVYPQEVIKRLGQYSISGGVFTPDGKLFCTGHDNPEIYVLSLPPGGSTLVLEEIFPIPMKGQGIALAPENPSTLYGIDRVKRAIVITSVTG